MADPTNTSKLPAQLPQSDKSRRQAQRILKSSQSERLKRPSRFRKAIRIPQSCPLNCLNQTSPDGRPYEYFKVPGSYALNARSAAGRQFYLFPLSSDIIWEFISKQTSMPSVLISCSVTNFLSMPRWSASSPASILAAEKRKVHPSF